MSKIIVNSIKNDKHYACEIVFPNGNSTNIVSWEYKSIKNSSRLFIFMLLFHYEYINGGDTFEYHSMVEFIEKL